VLAECLSDLAARINTVPSLAGKVGINLLGRGADPGLVNSPLPVCTVTFSHQQVDEKSIVSTSRDTSGSIPAQENLLTTYMAIIFVPNGDGNDYLTVELPLLEAAIRAVKMGNGSGTRAQLSPSGYVWRFLGQKLSLVQPARLGFEQHYTLRMMI
jgi:hypothetical protein